MKRTAPHITQYQGSKRNLAPQILNYFPKKFNRLIEPFAGMAAVSIATAQQNRTDNYVINDINYPVISLLQSAIESPEILTSNYEKLWNEQFDYTGGSVEHYYHVRDLFNDGYQEPEKILYLLARCVKGSVRYGHDLPEWLDCEKIYLNAGISTQAILLGKKEVTYEALYVSNKLKCNKINIATQMSIFEELAV